MRRWVKEDVVDEMLLLLMMERKRDREMRDQAVFIDFLKHLGGV